MLVLVDRGESILRPGLSHDLEVESACATCSAQAGAADTREDGLVDVRELNEDGLFGDEEDGFFEEEKVALDGFKIGFDSWMPSATTSNERLENRMKRK